MSERGKAPPEIIAVMIATPVLVACCVAPAFMAAAAATFLGWISGIGVLISAALFVGTMAVAYWFLRYRNNQDSDPLQLSRKTHHE